MRALPGRAARLDESEAPLRSDLAAEQRRRILETAVELFAKRGYHDTTIERIVRRGRVGYQTYYGNFPDKESCFLAIFDAAAARAERRIAAAYRSVQGPWPDRVAVVIATLFDLIAANPKLSRVCLVEALTAGPAVTARYEEASRALHPILRRGRALNPRGDQLPETLEQTISDGILWIAYQRLILGEADRLAEQLSETIEFALTPYLGEVEAVRAANGISLGTS